MQGLLDVRALGSYGSTLSVILRDVHKRALGFYEDAETGGSSAPIKIPPWIPQLVCVLKELVTQVPLTDHIFRRLPQLEAGRARDRGVP